MPFLFGADVTVLSTHEGKRSDAMKLGAHNFVVTTNEEQLKTVTNTFDFILDTLSANHDYNMYVTLLKTGGGFYVVLDCQRSLFKFHHLILYLPVNALQVEFDRRFA